jgi:hypothetical protein
MKKISNIEKIKRGLYSNLLKEGIDCTLNDFLKILSEKESLQYQYLVHKNIVEALKENDTNVVKTLIKENLGYLDKFKASDFNISELNNFIIFEKSGVVNKVEESIHKLIESYIIKGNNPGISRLINTVIKESVNQITEEVISVEPMNIGINSEVVIKHVLDKFNKKYSGLNENQKTLLKAILNEDIETQEKCYDILKSEVIKQISEDKELDKDLITETINIINKKGFNKETLVKDVMELNELI